MKCPHCEKEGAEKLTDKQAKCQACDKSFLFREITLFVTVPCACLNGGEHTWRRMPELKSVYSDAKKCVYCLDEELGDITHGYCRRCHQPDSAEHWVPSEGIGQWGYFHCDP